MKDTDTNKEDPLKNQKWAAIDAMTEVNKLQHIEEGRTPAYFQIASKGQEIIDMLQQKNTQYGNSVLSPNRIFSKADTSEQIRVRIDDKLNRLISGDDSIESDEDVIFDLIGYLILLLVHMEYYTQTLQGDDEP